MWYKIHMTEKGGSAVCLSGCFQLNFLHMLTMYVWADKVKCTGASSPKNKTKEFLKFP